MTALRLGTRGSLLALAQSNWTASALEANGASEVSLEVIRTVGDEHLDQPLHEISGKGLFTRELDEALLSGRVDLAVHSLCCPRGCVLPPRRDESILGTLLWGQKAPRPHWLH